MEEESHLVLCVDDEVVGLRVRKILLERAGYQVLTALDGPPASNSLTTNQLIPSSSTTPCPECTAARSPQRCARQSPASPSCCSPPMSVCPQRSRHWSIVYMTKGEGAPTLL